MEDWKAIGHHNRCIKEQRNREEESAVEVQQQLLNGILRWRVTLSYMLVSKGCTSNTTDDEGIRLHKVNISLISFPSTYLGFFFCSIVIYNNPTHTVCLPPPLSVHPYPLLLWLCPLYHAVILCFCCYWIIIINHSFPNARPCCLLLFYRLSFFVLLVMVGVDPNWSLYFALFQLNDIITIIPWLSWSLFCGSLLLL